MRATALDERTPQWLARAQAEGIWIAGQESVLTRYRERYFAEALPALKGREVRVMVRPESVDDLGAEVMARDIAKRIEEELQYPGQIKVMVIREHRAVEYAK